MISERPRRLSAFVAKILMYNISPDNEGLEECHCSSDMDFANERDSSDFDLY